MVVVDGPLGVAGGAAGGWLRKRGVAHAKHSKPGWQAVQAQENAVEGAQQLRTGAKGSNYLGTNRRLNGPFGPFL